MIQIVGSTLVTTQTVSKQAAWDKLRGTPLEPWTNLFIQGAYAYGIDLNWILSYLQWETGFGEGHFSMDFNNPWDMLCSAGAPECRQAPNGYWYRAYATMEEGIEAGYQLWASYVARGWNTWFTSLSVALCGNPAGCVSSWVDMVIAQGQANADLWPYTGPPTDGNDLLTELMRFAAPLMLGLVLVGIGIRLWPQRPTPALAVP